MSTNKFITVEDVKGDKRAIALSQIVELLDISGIDFLGNTVIKTTGRQNNNIHVEDNFNDLLSKLENM